MSSEFCSVGCFMFPKYRTSSLVQNVPLSAVDTKAYVQREKLL